MILEPDFLEFIELLNKNEVEYLLVGAHALAFFGRPRNTGDLDIWINSSGGNAVKILNVLNDFGFGSLGLKTEDFTKKNQVVQLGYPPLRINILNSLSGVTFQEAYSNRINAQIKGITIWVIGLDEFRKNKLATGRKKDLGDIELLEKMKKKRK